MKRVLVKFSTLTTWNTGVVRSAGAADGETELRAKRETRRIEVSGRMRWIPIQPSSIGTMTKPRVTMGKKLNSGMMAVTQSKRCHEETASVRRVRCRIANKASLKQVVALIVTEPQVTMLKPWRGCAHVYKVKVKWKKKRKENGKMNKTKNMKK